MLIHYTTDGSNALCGTLSSHQVRGLTVNVVYLCLFIWQIKIFYKRLKRLAASPLETHIPEHLKHGVEHSVEHGQLHCGANCPGSDFRPVATPNHPSRLIHDAPIVVPIIYFE